MLATACRPGQISGTPASRHQAHWCHAFQTPLLIRIPVRKTYTLNIEGKNRDRLLEASKHDIRKYLKRERNKTLPAGVDYWDFDTK